MAALAFGGIRSVGTLNGCHPHEQVQRVCRPGDRVRRCSLRAYAVTQLVNRHYCSASGDLSCIRLQRNCCVVSKAHLFQHRGTTRFETGVLHPINLHLASSRFHCSSVFQRSAQAHRPTSTCFQQPSFVVSRSSDLETDIP